jgi:SAM-dependent methyltransferase
MSRLFERNPTGRFTGLAENYARYRPDYPKEAIDFIIAHCWLSPDSTVIDIGCGTGISSRMLAARGFRVIGIEPNTDMRATAEAEASLPGTPVHIYRDGRAENTGLPAGCADAVLAAQAFHWFEPEPALREFHRILKPDGWVVLLWNERDARDPFMAAYGAIIRTARSAAAVEVPRGEAGTPLLSSRWFQHAQRVAFTHEQILDEDGMIGRAFSASYAPREPEQVKAWQAALQNLFTQFQQNGKVSLRYETAVYLAQRRQAAVTYEP